jgi:type I restriction enzyme, S subunit
MADHEINEIALPNNWLWTTLEEVVDTTRQRRHPHQNPDLPYIGLENIESETMRLVGTQAASDLKSMADYFESGDVLYGRLRPYLNKVFRPDFEGLCSSEFIIFRQLENLHNKYVQYLINSRHFVSFAMSRISGDRPRVDIGDLGAYRFPLAPINEQHRIVEEIEAQFSRLEAWLETMQKLRDQLPRLRASIFKAAVEGRLVSQDPHDKSAAVLIEAMLTAHKAKWQDEQLVKMSKPPKDDSWKSKYQPPQSPDLTELSQLPNGWQWVTIDICTDYSIYGPRFSSDDYDATGIPVIRTTDIDDNGKIDLSQVPRILLDDKQIEKYQLLPGDLLVTRTGSIGTVAIFPGASEPCIPGAYLIHFRMWNKFVNAYYILNYLISPDGQRQLLSGATSVTLSNINAPAIRAIKLPLPPLEEQSRIVNEIALKLSVLSRLEVSIDVNIKRASRMRQSILKKAFEGRLVEQDPNDEPASSLLERIKAERQHRTKEQAEKPKQPRGRKVSTKTGRKSLYDTLKEAKSPLSPGMLFHKAGFSKDSTEDIDQFYEELRGEIQEERIVQQTSGTSLNVMLRATDHAD